MFGIFGKNKKKDAVDDKRRIYVPEEDLSKEYPFSGWRKPLDVNEANPRPKYMLLDFEFGTLKAIDILNVVLCVFVLLGITKLVFFTTYEQTVLVDGTELSCLILDDGSVVPYIPPRAPSVPMPKVPLINEGPMVAPIGQAAILGNKPTENTQVNPNSGMVAVPAISAPQASVTTPSVNTVQPQAQSTAQAPIATSSSAPAPSIASGAQTQAGIASGAKPSISSQGVSSQSAISSQAAKPAAPVVPAQPQVPQPATQAENNTAPAVTNTPSVQ